MPSDGPTADRTTAALSIVAGVGGLAGSYAVAGGSNGYLVEPFSSGLAEYTPEIVFRYFRNELGSTVQGFLAVALAVATVAVIASAAISVAYRIDRPGTGSLMAAIGTAVVGALLTGTVWPAIGAGLATGVVVAVGEMAASYSGRSTAGADRRRFLGGLATAVGLSALSPVLANRFFAGSGVDKDPLAEQGRGLATVDRGEIDSLLSSAEEKSLDVAGIEPLVSEDFYTVDINQFDPTVAVDSWSLKISGEVDAVRVLDYEAIREMEPEHRFVTLRCVSDDVNGSAIDNALWTGVPFSKVVAGTNPRGEYVLLHGADGYSVGFPLAAIEDGFLAYGMNGKVLPKAHGFPLRALVPGHWGETNVKWITEIEITDELVDGYWESRGWEGTGPVHTVAKIRTVNRGADGSIEVGGHAYAGTRGISGVEVSVDGGDTWEAARVSDPLPGDDVWRQWRHEYDAPGSKHEVLARGVEADGTVQRREPQDAFPEGATGYASKVVKP
ncbi:MAG: DMSO/TMAO reductase YedYZ molybdopterin-dependent catalytic subunit [Halobacteriales archaeon]|jgi:DMSO/TMAO reductase YedYZ molybdopterin-dependent catalytic subunit